MSLATRKVLLGLFCCCLPLFRSAWSQLSHSLNDSSCGDIICPGGDVLYNCSVPIHGSVIVWRMAPECERNGEQPDITFLFGDSLLSIVCNDGRKVEVQGMTTSNGTRFVSSLNVTNITSSQTVECLFDDGSQEETIGNNSIFTTVPTIRVVNDTTVDGELILALDQRIENCSLIDYAVNGSTSCGICHIVAENTVTCANVLLGSVCIVEIETKLCGIPVEITTHLSIMSTTTFMTITTPEGSNYQEQIATVTIVVVVVTVAVIIIFTVTVAVYIIVKTYKRKLGQQEMKLQILHSHSKDEKCDSLTMTSPVSEKSTPPTSVSMTRSQCINGSMSRIDNLLATCQELLAACYLEQTEDLESYNWPPVKYNAFVPFTMIKQKSKQHSTVKQRVDSTLVGEEMIDYADFLHELQSCSGKLVLIEGRPGSGKSTLVINISKDWAKGEILPSKLFFLVRLRMLHGQEKLTLLSLLSTLFKDLSALGSLEPLSSYIISKSGENVVFALDGLDEYSPTKDDFFHELIAKKCLPKSTVIITSRPAAIQSFKKNARIVIDVIGFTGEQIPDYINRHFSDDQLKAQNLISHLQQHNSLVNACYLPLHLNMLVFLYQEDNKLLATETQMYNHVTLSTLLRSIKKRENDESEVVYLESFNDLPPEDKLLFDKICELAFDATLSLKQSFTSTELKDKRISNASSKGRCQDMLDLVVVDRQVSLRGQTEVYSFFHLSFQEYLASVHISKLDPSQILELAKKYRNNPALNLVWKFVCGTLDYSLNKFTFKSILLSEQCPDIMTKFYFANESQQELCCSFVVDNKVIHLPTKKQLSFSDCSILGYVISRAASVVPTKPVEINFQKTNLNDDGVIAFLKQVEHVLLNLRISGKKSVYPFLEGLSRCPIQGLVHIRIFDTKLGIAEIQKFVSSLKNCLTLQTLVLTESDIDVDGLMAIGDTLKHWINLQLINFDNNKFGEKGAEVLSRALVSCPTLTSINLSHNHLGDAGTAFLAEGLNHCKKIEELSLEKNDISDDGFVVLLDSLKSHESLQHLNVQKNKISAHGVQALVACSAFVRLKVINLCENNIGDLGVKHLVEGAMSVTGCLDLTTLDLFGNSITNEGLKYLKKFIEVARNLKQLNIRGNQFDDSKRMSLREARSKRTEDMAELTLND